MIDYFFRIGENILVKENWFLIVLALVWISVAVIQDFKRREVENWWNFSLIAFALAYRAFLSISQVNTWYLLWGIIGLVAGFILCNAFYYARLFAGGDSKLLMALGTILPLSLNLKDNIILFVAFIILFIFSGAIYGLVYSLIISAIHFTEFRVSFRAKYKEYKKKIWIYLVSCLLVGLVFYFVNFYLGVIITLLFMILPVLLLFSKAVEEACLIVKVSISDLTIGDWLYADIKLKIKGKTKIIKPNWEGLSESELELIKNHYRGKVEVRYGIPFTPAFLIGFIVLLFLL